MQTIYVRDDETHFAGLCDECLTARGDALCAEARPHVAGTLRRDVDVGFRTCRARPPDPRQARPRDRRTSRDFA